jgi:anaerobic magnesium-protoporphyrin IX monomethyl ester cyclase
MAHEKQVLLLSPSLVDHFYGSAWQPVELPTPPLGLLYIATYIMKAGYEVKFVDLSVDHLSEVQYVDELRKPDFILITCLTNALDNIHRIIRDIKSVNDTCHIICGGSHCNETSQHVQGSDLTVYGEAELVIVNIMERLSTGRSLENIPGISYLKDGKLLRNEGHNIIDNLDLIDPPSIELSREKNYNYAYGIKIGRVLPIITTRGCPFHCSFCTYPTIKYRERSVDDVLSEIELGIKKFKPRYLMINDDNFLLKRKRVERLADAVIRNKIKIKIILQGRADLADVELFRKLRKAGVIVLMFGIESANQDVLNYYNKGTTVEKIEKIIRIANRFGIITFSGFMIGAPIEHYAHFENNKQFLAKVPLDFMSVNILRFAFPSPLWWKAHREGKILEEELIVSANEKLSNFTYEELMVIRADMLKSFYTEPARILRIVYKVMINFGILLSFRVIQLALGRSLAQTLEDFYGNKIQRKRKCFNSKQVSYC